MRPLERVGKRFANRYDIESILETDGTGNVYRALDRETQRRIALKIIAEPSAAIRKRFIREASVLSALVHPSIVAIYASGEDGDFAYIAREIVLGETLCTWCKRGVTLGFLLGTIAQVLDGLAFVHEHDVLHRDIKPTNILVTNEGHAKLVDFGLSRRISDLSAGTQAGEVARTVAYLPPERFLGKPSDARGDLYSIGIVLYEFLTGFVPFRTSGGDLVAMVFAHLNEHPMPPREVGATIDTELERIVMRLLEKDPVDRFATAADTRDALLAYLESHPETSARPLDPRAHD